MFSTRRRIRQESANGRRGAPIKDREPDAYFELIRKFPLKPLRTEGEYDEAVAVMEKLAVRGEHGLDSGERDYLDVLGRMISDYDDRRYPISPDTRMPAERLRDLMADHGMNISALGRVIGRKAGGVHVG